MRLLFGIIMDSKGNTLDVMRETSMSIAHRKMSNYVLEHPEHTIYLVDCDAIAEFRGGKLSLNVTDNEWKYAFIDAEYGIDRGIQENKGGV